MSTSHCPVCGSTRHITVLQRAGVPVHQNLLYRTWIEAREAPTADLDIAMCRMCTLIFNRQFQGDLLHYSTAYENDQSCSRTFREHIVERSMVVSRAARALGSPAIVEVGCGQGYFLDALADRIAGVTLLGFDPAYRGGSERGAVRIQSVEFGQNEVSAVPVGTRVIVSRQVVEHIADPVPFLEHLRSGLSDGASVAFIETPCVAWSLGRMQVQDLYYEHCSLFNERSLTVALRNAGFGSVRAEHVFAGQYLWATASTGTSTTEAEEDETDETGRMRSVAARFADEVTAFRDRWRDRCRAAMSHGLVAVWGGGAKGATFCNLVDPHREVVECIVDINPMKQGSYVAVSGHRIVSPADASSAGVRTAIVMNPLYLDEIRSLVRDAALPFELLVT